jgi:nitrite reductase/ring-hydroxylating ferredoxin subunit
MNPRVREALTQELIRQRAVLVGEVAEGRLLCPWHGIAFDVATGTCPVMSEERVPTYPVEIRDGQVWVAIGPA